MYDHITGCKDTVFSAFMQIFLHYTTKSTHFYALCLFFAPLLGLRLFVSVDSSYHGIMTVVNNLFRPIEVVGSPLVFGYLY